MNIGNILGSILGGLTGIGTNRPIGSMPSINIEGQVSQLQNVLNASMANQMARLSQYMLGAQQATGSPGAANQGSANMVGGLNSFYGPTMLPLPGMNPVNTASAAATELAPSFSAQVQDKDKLIESLIDESINSSNSKIDAKQKEELIKKLKDDYKDVPVETLELLKKNGTKINIVSKDTSLADLGLINSMTEKDAAAAQNTVIENLKNIKESNKFKYIDPEVLKQNEMEKGKAESKGLTTFKEQFINELADVYYAGKTPTDQDIAKFKDVMRETHNIDGEIMGFTEAWKKKKEKTTDPKEVERIDKILTLEEMLAKAKQAPVKYEEKYYNSANYAILDMWNKGDIQSLYSIKDKVMYLREDVLGKVMSDKDPGKVSVHELGHALGKAMGSLSPNFEKAFRTKVEEGFTANQKNDEDPEKINTGGKNEFISLYSSLNPEEYWAETFSAYFNKDKANLLKENDPKQYNLITALLKEFSSAKQLAVRSNMAAKSA